MSNFNPLLSLFHETFPKFDDGRINYSFARICCCISCFVVCNDKVLLIQRSDKVGDFHFHWGPVTGYLDSFDDPVSKALEELQEEIGLSSDIISDISSVDPVILNNDSFTKKWVIYPVVVSVDNIPKISLNWESTDHRWVSLDDVSEFNLLPGTFDVLRALNLRNN